MEEKGGLNLYGFCLNNSINLWDLLGMSHWDDDGDDPNIGGDDRGGAVFPGFVDDIMATTPTAGGLPTLIDPSKGIFASSGLTAKVWVPSALSVPKGKIVIFDMNIPADQRAAVIAQVNETLDLMKKNSPTFAAALEEILKNSSYGISIVPVAGSGGGMMTGNSLVFGLNGSERDDGSKIYPSYTLAHELGHLQQGIGTHNTAWDLDRNNFGFNDDGTPMPARAIAPNSAEYYAYNFAQQVANEIRDNAAVDIGNQKNYWDNGTTRNIGLIPRPSIPK